MTGIPEAGEEPAYNNNIDLEISYKDRDGKIINITKLTQGTDFMAVVSVHNPGMLDYRDMALTQIFPSGWEIQNIRLSLPDLPEGSVHPTYQDIRDDRIYTYFDLMRGEKRTFIVRLTAAYAGHYYLPGAYCEAMYDNSISALLKGEWIDVIKAGN
jgi:uncharacterized protein YfaS (alpha-2-macroglobulin family)